MIIFNFGPFSTDELTIRFDPEGAAIFLSVVSSFLNRKTNQNSFDCLQHFRASVDTAKIEIRREGDNQLEIKGKKLILGMSDEALEYTKFLLEKFIADGDFSPPEFYSFSRKNRKHETQIFFLKFSSFEGGI